MKYIFLLLFRLSRKHIFIYWHESEWHWKELIPEKSRIRGIILNNTIYQLITNSINIAMSNYCAKWVENKFKLKSKAEIVNETIDQNIILKIFRRINLSRTLYLMFI